MEKQRRMPPRARGGAPPPPPCAPPCSRAGSFIRGCEDRVLDGPASGEKGSKGRNSPDLRNLGAVTNASLCSRRSTSPPHLSLSLSRSPALSPRLPVFENTFQVHSSATHRHAHHVRLPLCF